MTTRMDLEGILLNEISQKRKKINIMQFHLYTESKTRNPNQKTEQMFIENRLVVT